MSTDAAFRARKFGFSLFVGAVVFGLTVSVVAPVAAQLVLNASQRAADGTAYEVISIPNAALFGGADEFRVTTVAGSPIGLQPCSSIGASDGDNARAIVGGDLSLIPAQQLHPIASIVRTGVLAPNNATVTFNTTGATGSGRLTLGTGAGAIDVCLNAADCSGGAANASIVALSSNAGSIPPACVANGVAAACASGNRSVVGFGLPMTGTTCNSLPTTSSTVCGARPTDGFTLQKGEVAVFIYYSGLGATGFSFGAAGFGVDTNGINDPTCEANQIVTADAQAPSTSAPPIRQQGRHAPALSWPVLAALAVILVGAGLVRIRMNIAVNGQ